MTTPDPHAAKAALRAWLDAWTMATDPATARDLWARTGPAIRQLLTDRWTQHQTRAQVTPGRNASPPTSPTSGPDPGLAAMLTTAMAHFTLGDPTPTPAGVTVPTTPGAATAFLVTRHGPAWHFDLDLTP